MRLSFSGAIWYKNSINNKKIAQIFFFQVDVEFGFSWLFKKSAGNLTSSIFDVEKWYTYQNTQNSNISGGGAWKNKQKISQKKYTALWKLWKFWYFYDTSQNSYNHTFMSHSHNYVLILTIPSWLVCTYEDIIHLRRENYFLEGIETF